MKSNTNKNNNTNKNYLVREKATLRAMQVSVYQLALRAKTSLKLVARARLFSRFFSNGELKYFSYLVYKKVWKGRPFESELDAAV